jgi:peptidoglycan/LPS O-acetylase OafA/YrhL
MDQYQKQRSIFTIVGILLLVSVVSLIAVIPALIQQVTSDSIPREAAIATAVGAGTHLLLAIAFFIGARLARLKRRINAEINLASAIVLVILGFIILDGAAAYWDSLRFVSVGMFLCVFCDFAAVIVSLAALFILRRKKKDESG